MNRYRSFRYGRIVVQTLAVVLITMAVATGVPCLFSRMQIVPAIAACSTVWLVVWLVATLIFGRIYCSTVCPLGSLIDLFSFVLRSRKSHYTYCMPSGRLRLSVLVIAAICAVFGVTAVIAVLDPYSAFARMVTACARPFSIGVAGLSVAAATLAIIVIFSRRRGRLLCNTLCPVGTILGGVSRVSVFHADINTDLCTNCGRCADVCSSQCINLTDHVVDLSRCVVCFDCMDVCPDSAITYRRGRHQLSIPLMMRVADDARVSASGAPINGSGTKLMDRRGFFAGVVSAAGTWSLAATDSSPAGRMVEGATMLRPLNHVIPPGALSREDYLRRCTGCGACVAVCSTGVLTSSVRQFGMRHALAPVVDFDKVYCRPDCVACSQVCPSGALTPLSQDEKQTVVIGRARISASNCMLYVNSEPCSVCVRRCPRGALSVNEVAGGRTLPHVDPELCIGCGICAVSCPSEPYGAIVIEGI